jgi:hypothetical protein
MYDESSPGLLSEFLSDDASITPLAETLFTDTSLVESVFYKSNISTISTNITVHCYHSVKLYLL